MEPIEWNDLAKVELHVGRIANAEPFPQARKPAYLLHVDAGAEIGLRKSGVQIAHLHRPGACRTNRCRRAASCFDRTRPASLLRGETAIHQVVAAGDERSLLRQQETGQRRDFLRRAQAADGVHRDQ